MPRFHFDIDNGATLMRDDEGSDLADLASAEHEATETLVQMARDAFGPSHGGQISVSIRDGSDSVLLHMRLVLIVEREASYENIPIGDGG